ncbi:MAG: hypothetical protein CL916_12085 [Deltaproteobacteria bacterium]|nr:hypothetical protein [Deltaproteobacteria bacterium]
MSYAFTFSYVFCLFSNTSFAEDNSNADKIGVGLGSGTTTSAFTAKKYFEPNTAVQAFVGTRGATSLHTFSLGADALFEFTLREADIGRFFYGYGAGIGMFSYSGLGFDSIGFSGVGELGVHFSSIPLEIIIDIRPSIFLGDFAGISLLSGGSAVRWYF